jgi:2-polyprenyl-6-hydroxyphenyl methylase/3-demethylubiquinone-9 3-methyltransferase
VGAEYVLGIVPRGTHEYAKFIKPSELAASAERSGLSVVGLKGLEHNPIKKTFWLSADTSVNYMLAARRPA